MIEQKIKELLEKYFLNIQNWKTKTIYIDINRQLESISFDLDNFDTKLYNASIFEKEIKEICNKYSTYYIEPEIKILNKTISIKFRYFTRVK